VTIAAPPNDAGAFIAELDALIAARKKMTSKLYQVILAGEAPLPLLQQFVVHRYPIKAFWTRNILGIASRLDDYELRRELVENIYEEETGALTGSKRHLESFLDFGLSLGLTREQVVEAKERLPETDAVIAHNVRACNGAGVDFNEGVASVLLLMEGQPPIVSRRGRSMEAVMRDVYRLPPEGCAYFTHHASTTGGNEVSALEGDHASTARRILARYCRTEQARRNARAALEQAIDLRHRHFDAILARGHDPSAPPYRAAGGQP
jgi:pyrroloquinoline-quinone synthase